MEMSRIAGSPQSSTAMYRPPDATESRPAAELVAGSAPVNENELVPLLRRRLRFLLVVFALLYLMILILHVCYFYFPFRIDFWAGAATFVVCVCLAAVLSGTPWMTLRQLRVIEFLLCAVFAGRMVPRHAPLPAAAMLCSSISGRSITLRPLALAADRTIERLSVLGVASPA